MQGARAPGASGRGSSSDALESLPLPKRLFAMTRPRSTHAVALAVLAAAVAWFYLWTASEGRAFPLGAPQDGHYNLLAQALARGQLHLLVEPRPELLELVDPYDPAKNAPYRLHDASLYRGRYYLYYGVAPALALFVPFRLIGVDLPESLAAAVFALAAFTFAALVLGRLMRSCAPGAPFGLRLVALGALALTNGMPFVLRGASVYEVAITAGVCFLWAAAFVLSTSGDDGRVRPFRLALGSLLLGLAVGSRPSHVFAAPLLLAIAIAALPAGAARRPKTAAAALLPLGLVLGLLGAYNAARFSSPFEFGTRYQLSGNHPHGLLWLDPRGVLPGLYFNFLAPPSLRLDFPFVFLERRYPWTLPPGYFGPELIAGVFLLVPFILVLAAVPSFLRRNRSARGPATVTLALLAGVGFLNPLVTSFLIGAANQRYEADFVSFLVVPALASWLLLRERLAPGSPAARRVAVIMGLALAWAAAAAVALSLTGYEDSLRRGNPALFRRLAQHFEPLRVRLGRVLMRDARAVVRFRMALADRPAATLEPLVSAGSPAAQDVLYVRTLGPGLVAFVIRGGTGAEQATGPVALRPGHFHTVTVDLDRVLRHVLVRIDERDPLRLAAELGPLVAGQVWLGRGAKGKDAHDLGRFSGALVSEVMEWARPGGATPLPDISATPTLWTEDLSLPPTGRSGELWASSARDGAFLHDGAEWRWVARHRFDRLKVLRLLPRSVVGRDEPLLSSGDATSADVVLVRMTDPGHGRFSYLRLPGAAAVHGPVLTLPEPAVPATIVLDRAGGRVLVSVGDQKALDVAADLLPIDRSGLSLGRLPKGLEP